TCVLPTGIGLFVLLIACCQLFARFFFLILPPPPRSTLFPYTTLFRSARNNERASIPPGSPSDTSSRCSRQRPICGPQIGRWRERSEEHTSELQSRENLVCRLLLEKKKNKTKKIHTH